MLVRDFDYELPEELIAQRPLAERAASRMLVFHREAGTYQDDVFQNLPSFLQPGDLLVMNDTRVIPARLFAERVGLKAQPVSPHNPAARQHLHGRIEVLLTAELAPFEWSVLVRPARKVAVGETLFFFAQTPLGERRTEAPLLTAQVVGAGEFGERRIRFAPVANFFELLDRLGHVPLPPYIRRADEGTDRERYQTVFARQHGSVAAPTAGLHFSPEILAAIRSRGVETAAITLHVGLGTFQPVRADRVADIHLHAERYTIPAETADAVNRALRDGRRIIAVGTTTTRTLEHCAQMPGGPELQPHSGETSLFIAPGFRFQIVRGLFTNFHLPQSTLLMLVCAFGGVEPVLAAYRHAVAARYRFFSYGDCMFLA